MSIRRFSIVFLVCIFFTLVNSCSEEDFVNNSPFFSPIPFDPEPSPGEPANPNFFVVPLSGFLTPLPGTDHEVMVLGLNANKTYTIDVPGISTLNVGFLGGESVIEDTEVPLVKILHFSTATSTTPSVIVTEGEDTNEDTVAVIETDPLPDNFPPIEVLVSRPEDMSPGVTIFNNQPNGDHAAFMTIVDNSGEVVWFRQGVRRTGIRLANGNLLIGDSQGLVEEVDMLGNIVRSMTHEDVDQVRFHHDLIEMENGHLLTLAVELRNIGPYPPDDEFFDVVGDVILEFTWDGEIINEILLHDILDPFRVLPGFDIAFYNDDFGMLTKDWTHANSIIHDPSDNSYILSLRHQDMVIKVNYEGELVWVLGEDHPDTSGDDDWPFLALIGPGTFPNHQHSADLTPDGDLILYDNANATELTRPAIFRIDEDNLTMTQEWEYFDETLPFPICAPFVGDANYLSADSVLIGHMAARVPGDDCSSGQRKILIQEVDRFTGEKLFELEVMDTTGDHFTGYRAVRLPTLYPN